MRDTVCYKDEDTTPGLTLCSASLGQNLGHCWLVLDSEHFIDMEESGTSGTNSMFLFPA